MTEVAVRDGTGQAATLGTLAERINDEHRAYEAAYLEAIGHVYDAVDHAMNAGDLLEEVKAQLDHGDWIPWLKANCIGLSVRRAQEFMFLARGREDLEEAKARNAAFFKTIGGALEFLREAGRIARQEKLPNHMMGGPDPFEDRRLSKLQERTRKAKAREEYKLLQQAEFAIRTGNLEPPAEPNISPGAWELAISRATALREQNLPNVLDLLAHQLHILSKHASSEQVAQYLLEQRIGHEEEERRADVLAELRAGLIWLQRVLEAAERMQGSE